MIRAIITIDGFVQRVGYRYNVAYIAKKYNLKGYVKNLDDGRVEVIVEGNKDSIESFIKDIDIKEHPIYVESMDVNYQEAKNEFKTFKIITGSLEDEMVEGFGTGALYLNTIKNEIKEFREESRANFNDLKNEIKEFKEEFKDYRSEFRDFANRTDDNFNDLKNEIREFREESRANFKELKDEVRGTRNEIKEFREETKESFIILNTKYGEISDKLTMILEQLRKDREEANKRWEDLNKDLKKSIDILIELVRSKL